MTCLTHCLSPVCIPYRALHRFEISGSATEAESSQSRYHVAQARETYYFESSAERPWRVPPVGKVNPTEWTYSRSVQTRECICAALVRRIMQTYCVQAIYI
eukprot:1099846-Amphidinium_carterae.1